VSQARGTPQAQGDESDRILQALQLVKTPAVRERLVDYVEAAVREHAGCKGALFWVDENPRIEAEENLDDEIKHIVEHHVDTLVCDGREFEVEAVYELYSVCDYYCYNIIHSFKPVRVQMKEPKLKPEEITPADAFMLLPFAIGVELAHRLHSEAYSENKEKQPQAQEAKSKQG
jgi:hypothetical protein